jgi:hypothetical protein
MTKIVTIQVWGREQEVIATPPPEGAKGDGWYKVCPHLEAGEKPFGGHDYHLWDGEICYGYISWEPHNGMKISGHTLVSIDPVTIQPSLDCRSCASHGHITDGRWIEVG